MTPLQRLIATIKANEGKTYEGRPFYADPNEPDPPPPPPNRAPTMLTQGMRFVPTSETFESYDGPRRLGGYIDIPAGLSYNQAMMLKEQFQQHLLSINEVREQFGRVEVTTIGDRERRFLLPTPDPDLVSVSRR